MAHEFESGLFVGQPAWHGLGTVLDSPPTIQEAIKLAGLDWRVDLVPLTAHYLNDIGQSVALKTDSFATVRSSDTSVLGTVGPDYHPVQNADVFDWFNPFIDAGCTIEAAGSLRNGKRVWCLARTPGGAADIVPGDRVDQFILLAHAHDGTIRITAGYTSVRVVCQNTLSAALGGPGFARIKHTKNAKDRMGKAQETIASVHTAFAKSVEQYRALAATKCSKENFNSYMRDVFNFSETDDIPRVVKRVAELQETGKGTQLPGVQGTMWGAYNAVTEFLTHERGRTQDARLESQWFGDSAAVADPAMSVGLDYSRFAA